MHFSEKDTMKLKQAFEEYNSEMLSDLPTEDRLKKIFFSPRFEKKMKKLINGQKRHFYQIADTAAKRAACISVILFAVALFGAELSHAPITGSLSGSDYQGSMGGNFGSLAYGVPKYIPDGFSLSKEERENGSYEATYKNAENVCLTFRREKFIPITEESDVNLYFALKSPLKNLYDSLFGEIESTGAPYSEGIKIKGMRGTISVNGKKTRLVLYGKNSTFIISGEIARDEIIKIAKSIKF